MIIPKRTDYKFSLVRAVVSLRTDAAPYYYITFNARLIFYNS